jgi:hypothetical protein
MVTFAERMAVPIINIALQYFIPFILIKKSKSPLFSTAIGQFIFVSFFQAKYGEGLSWKGRVCDVSGNDKTKLIRENHWIN